MDKIIIYTGPMFAGKSSALINEINTSPYNKSDKLIFNYAGDKRYTDTADISSHNKEVVKSIAIVNCFEINKYITDNVKVIFIDEVQFIDCLKDWIENSEKYLLNVEKIVIAGLNYDVYGNCFNEQFSCLITYLQYINNKNVKLLHANCYINDCCNKADYTILLDENNDKINEKDNVLVGSKDIYQPSCLVHALQRPYKHNFTRFMVRY